MSLFERYLPSLVESHDSAEIFKNRFFLARVYQEAFTQKQQVVFKQKALILIDFLENDLAQRDTNDIYAKNSKQSIRLLKSFFMDLSDNQIRQWKNIVELNKQVIILNKTEQQIPQREQLIRKLQRLHESDRSNSYFLTYHLLSNYRKQAIDQTKSHNIAEALRNTQSAFDLDVNDDKTKAKLGLLLVIQYKFDEGMDILASVKNSSRIDEELLSLEKIGLTHVDFAKIKNHFREFKFPVAK